jgi:hypothetical protein
MKPIKMPFFYKTKYKRRLSVVIFTWMFIFSLVPLCLTAYFWSNRMKKQFDIEAERIHTAFFNEHKKLIKNDVDEIISDLDFGQRIIGLDNLKTSKPAEYYEDWEGRICLCQYHGW